MITFEETIQTVLNLVQEKAKLQLEIQQKDKKIASLEERIMELEAESLKKPDGSR